MADGCPFYFEGQGSTESPEGVEVYEALGQAWLRKLGGGLLVFLAILWLFWERLEAWADGLRTLTAPRVERIGSRVHPDGDEVVELWQVLAETAEEAYQRLLAIKRETEGPDYALGYVDRWGMMVTALRWTPLVEGVWTMEIQRRRVPGRRPGPLLV